MTAHMLAIGRADATGVYIRTGDGYQRVDPSREPLAQLTPLGAAVLELCEAIERGEVEPCPVCGKFGCDRDEWHEIMHGEPDADPHGDLSAAQAVGINY